MATQKKKATPVAVKAKSKNEPKKAPAKKGTVAKSAPAKKAVVKKAVSKTAPAQKTAPAKKVASKTVAPKKAALAKKADPAKKVVAAKKAVPANKIASAKKVAAKKVDAKAPTTKGVAAKKTVPATKKNSKPIMNNSPDKKTAKAGVYKAVPKNLATSKKTTEKKPAVAAKKSAPVPAVKKTETPKIETPAVKQPYKAKTESKVAAEAQSILDHKAQLKKAIATKKAKKQAGKKNEKPFVMPKVSTEKARRYEPEFTKSVLDAADIEYSGPTMRYNDNDLVEFRELITKKLDTAKKELGYLQGLITRKDQMGGDDTDNRYMTMEDGGLSMEREQLSQMASRQITFIDHLEKAMMRIENKTYGICRVTGKLIDKARLRAVPHATLSIEAKMGINK